MMKSSNTKLWFLQPARGLDLQNSVQWLLHFLDDDNFVEFPTSELSIKSMAADGMNIQCTRRLMMTYPSDDFDDDDTDNNADD